MVHKYTVPIPQTDRGISFKKIKNITYVYYDSSCRYDPISKRRSPQSKVIGKCADETRTMMYPNENYEKYFPKEADEQESLREEQDEERYGKPWRYVHRQWVVEVGNFIMLSQLMSRLGLGEMLRHVSGDLCFRMMDFLAYMFIKDRECVSDYEGYACEHALFTPSMEVLPDSAMLDMLESISEGMIHAFLEEWNRKQDHRHRIIVTSWSVHADLEPGDVDLLEEGDIPFLSDSLIGNISIAYDAINRQPVFYQCSNPFLPVRSELESVTDALREFRYRHILFVLDSNSVVRSDIAFLDKHGLDFLVVTKPGHALFRSLADQLPDVSGKPVDCIAEYEMQASTHIVPFCFPIAGDGKNDTKNYFVHIFQGPMQTKDRDEILSQDNRLRCFVMISNSVPSAKEALTIYKGTRQYRFRLTKEPVIADHRSLFPEEKNLSCQKGFLAFLVLIIRNELERMLQNCRETAGREKVDHLTVDRAIRVLNRVRIVRNDSHQYRLTDPFTTEIKEIFAAIGLTTEAVNAKIQEIGAMLKASAQSDPFYDRNFS